MNGKKAAAGGERGLGPGPVPSTRPFALGRAALPGQAKAPGAEAGERLLHRLWREQRLASGPLQAEDGSRVRVLFPGWPNGDRGPDFRGAVIAAGGRLIRGDVELHLRSRDWRLHGHDVDPEYANVVLHVVWRGEGLAPDSRKAAGARVRAVALEGRTELPVEALLLAGPHRAADPRPCVRKGPAGGEQGIGEALDREGERRFLDKAAALAAEAAAQGPGQALYRGLLEALGYSKNQEPFGELAGRLPYLTLVGMAAGEAPTDREALLQALLFGAAGLLPSQRGLGPDASPWVLEMERLWERRRYEPGGSPPAWRLFRVRPENAPPRRIAAAAGLVERFLGPGLVEGLAERLEGEGGRERLSALRQALTVAQEGYWACHVDFGRGWRPNPTLLGASRASDMVVNVALPFFYAWARERGNGRLQGRCLELYRRHPPLSDNHITREMERMLLPQGARGVVDTARRQQGLIGLYHQRCFGLLCAGCALAG